MRKINKQLGFSLIELMLAIAIVGMMLAVAIPSYSTYIKKGQVANVLKFHESFKAQIAEKISLTGSCPSSVTLGSLVLTHATAYVPASPSSLIKGGPVVQVVYYGTTSSNNGRPLCQLQAKLNSSLGDGYLDLQIMPNSDNGTLDVYCGFWNKSEASNSMPYVPSSCSRTDLSTL